MIKNKLAKMLTICLMFVFIIGTFCKTVHAESKRETEPNNTMETAETIMANHETAAQAVSGSRPSQHVVKGSTSNTDEDWFKVYLSAGTQYVTCNGDYSFEFEVRNPNGSLVLDKIYTKTGFGSTAYPFVASIDGFYYVKIKGITSSSSDYILLVGGPIYSVARCKVETPTVNMANGSDSSSSIDLQFESALPEDAVVYMLSMSGIRTTAVDGISVRNLSSNNTVNLSRYTWDKSGLVSLNMPLKGRWSITYGYSQDISFNPTISLYYAYPVTSTYVEDNVVIIQ